MFRGGRGSREAAIQVRSNLSFVLVVWAVVVRLRMRSGTRKVDETGSAGHVAIGGDQPRLIDCTRRPHQAKAAR